MIERDVSVGPVGAGGGRTLHVYDAGPDSGRLPVLWHHGTPGLGELPEPLLGVAAELDVRWIGYDRPGFGGSTRAYGRAVADAATDVEALADALGLDRFAVLGASGGATHALACGALLPNRVTGVVAIACLAPYPVDSPGSGAAGSSGRCLNDPDWFAGMYDGGAAELRAALAGADVLARHLATTDFDPEMFTASDQATLGGPWGWLGAVAGRTLAGGEAGGPSGMVDDDRAFVTPWGFEPAQVRVPTLLLHGDDDVVVPPAHGRWLGEHLPTAELRRVPGAGHVAVMEQASSALAWLAGSSAQR